MKKTITTWLALWAFVCCTAASAMEMTYGFVHADAGGRGHVYLAAPLRAADTLWLQWPDAQGGVHCCHKLTLAQLQRTDAEPAYEVSDDTGEIVHYLIQESPQPAPYTEFIGIALSGEHVSAQDIYHLQTHSATASARICFSTEGINLIARGHQRQGFVYLYLGYDIEQSPVCTDDDFASP